MKLNNKIGKVAMVAGMGVFMILAGMNNALSPDGTYAPVEMTVSMGGTFGDPMVMWRAIESPIIIWLGVVGIILTELTAGVFLLLGAFKLWATRSSASEFNDSKSIAITGLSVVACFYLIAFGVICQEWFMLWQNREVGTLQEAFRNFVTAMLIMFWINTSDD
jgi:predicted small integral membrane protein|tara:strand:- start:6771 stop:7259 length:489 start_codon:yes stop_codon:yes gene_type:complete